MVLRAAPAAKAEDATTFLPPCQLQSAALAIGELNMVKVLW